MSTRMRRWVFFIAKIPLPMTIRDMCIESSPRFRIGLVGGGLMGTDLFNYFSDFDFPLVWVVRNEKQCGDFSRRHARKCERLVRSRAADTAWMQGRMDSVLFTSSTDALEGCDIIFEAITEELEAKRRLFDVIEKNAGDSTVFVSTTSSIRPSRLSMKMRRGKRFAAVHFFFPVKLRNIAEVVFPGESSGETRTSIRSFLAAIGRRYIELPESESFLLNRVLLDYQATAYRMHLEKNIPLHVLDAIVKSIIHPSGVFEFFDAVGIDVARAAVSSYAQCAPDPGYYAPLIEALGALAKAGRNGKRIGAGFYDYPLSPGMTTVPTDCDRYDDLALLLVAVFINSCFSAMEREVCDDTELVNAIRESMGSDRGPVELAEMRGRERLRKILNDEYAVTGSEAIRPSRKW